MDKEILKRYIPKFVFQFRVLIKGFIASLKIPRDHNIFFEKNNESKIVIIGNGPSLKATMEKSQSYIVQSQTMVVNQFAQTDFFEIVKPNYYLLVDPAYFRPYSLLPSDLVDKFKKLSSALVYKTKWPMILITPYVTGTSNLLDEIQENKNIVIKHFNGVGGGELFSGRFRFCLWNKNFISPLGYTVLNTAISLSISMYFKEVYLIGADSSWHEDLRLDQNTNELYIEDKHFYGSPKRTRVYLDLDRTKPSKVHEELFSVATTLRSYWILEEYAKYNQVKVYNSTTYSWIDSFERYNITDYAQN